MSDLEKLLAEVWDLEIKVYPCPCGDPICSQHTLSNQGSVGFSLADATLFAMAPALLRKVIAAEKLVKAARKTVSPKTAMLAGLAPKAAIDRLVWAGIDDLEKAIAAWEAVNG